MSNGSSSQPSSSGPATSGVALVAAAAITGFAVVAVVDFASDLLGGTIKPRPNRPPRGFVR